MKELSLFKKIGITPQQIFYIVLADLFYALAMDLFYVGNNIAAGGLGGLGTVLNSIIGIPIGMTVMVLNIPIWLWGIRVKGKRYILITIITTSLFSAFVDLLSFLPCLSHDKLVAAICGGIIYGTAASFSVKAQLSAGGTDLLAKLIITKIKYLSLGQLLMMIDGSIVILAMFVYGEIEAGIYAILAIAITSIVTDKINSGFNKACMFYIFANQNVDKIADAILYEMNRGVTAIKAMGMYEKTERDILLAAVKPNEMPQLKAIIRRYDPTAFIILANAFEIVGNGFEDLGLTYSLEDEKNKKKIS